MSTRKGGPRCKPQKYQNATKFKNNLHDNSKLIQMLNNMEISGVCQRCKDQIQWRIDYKKYKPLAAPKKCVKCSEKNVKRAYTVVCEPCGVKLGVCLKCLEKKELTEKSELTAEEENKQRQELDSELRLLSERQRRSVERHMTKSAKNGTDQVSDWLQNTPSTNRVEEDDESDSDEPEDLRGELLTENTLVESIKNPESLTLENNIYMPSKDELVTDSYNSSEL